MGGREGGISRFVRRRERERERGEDGSRRRNLHILMGGLGECRSEKQRERRAPLLTQRQKKNEWAEEEGWVFGR